MKRSLFLLIWILSAGYSFGQLQPLSRNDSALLQEYAAKYEAEMQRSNLKEASRYLNETAFLYWNHNDYQKAITYYQQSLELNQQLGNENGIAMLHNNLGMLNSDVGDFEKALPHFEKTLAARKANKDNYGIISALMNKAVTLNNLQRHEEAARNLEEALSLARSMNNTDLMRSCYGMLSETYEKAGNIDESLKYYRLFQNFNELIQRGEIEKLQTEVEEEKLLKNLAETKSQIKEEELVAKQRELFRAERELNEFDSLNRQLYENLSNYELQLALVKQKAEIDQLKAAEERSRNMATIEQERSFRNMTLVVAVSLVLVIFFVIRNSLQIKKSERALSEKNEQIASQNTKLEELNKIVQAHNERMKTELNVGRAIQLSMVPSNFNVFKEVNEFEIFALLEPALEVGGDLYDFFMMDEDHLCFCVGDVSDKGVPAALFMAVTKTLIKTNAQYNAEPAKILTQTNKELSEDNESSMFVTFFLCVLNIKTGDLLYSNAGHNPPILRRASGEQELLRELHGPVLGAIDGVMYKQGSLKMNPGDMLILFTDGVTEAMNEKGELYSDRRLEELMQLEHLPGSKGVVDTVLDSVVAFRGEADQSDDITVLALQLNE